MECRDVKEQLAAYADDRALPAELETHLNACEGCASELAEYKALFAATSRIQLTTMDPPSWLLPSLTAAVKEKAEVLQASRQRISKLADPRVITGGVLVAAGVAGAMFFRGRRRRKRTFATRLRQSIAGA